jgi:Niemann-Pick C1 protein
MLSVLLLVAAAAIRALDLPDHGRCTIRGQCGKESFFSPELPCPYNGKASEPDDKLKEALKRVCGPSYASDLVCCDLAQVKSLESSLKKAENLIASCPACQQNFFDFFCTFTCSPDQARFLQIEEVRII